MNPRATLTGAAFFVTVVVLAVLFSESVTRYVVMAAVGATAVAVALHLKLRNGRGGAPRHSVG